MRVELAHIADNHNHLLIDLAKTDNRQHVVLVRLFLSRQQPPLTPPSLAADVPFNFTFPCEGQDYAFDGPLIQMPYNPNPNPAPSHTRSSSRASAYSAVSTPDSVSTRMTTPPRASPPVRHHGPILLPKIRSQDQAIETPAKRARSSASPRPPPARKTHARSYTMPETLSYPVPFAPQQKQEEHPAPLLCSPATFTTPTGTPTPEPRAASCGVEAGALERYGFNAYRQMQTYLPATTQEPQSYIPAGQDQESFMYIAPTDYPRESSLSFSPEPTPTTTLLSYLTAANPAPSLVRTISYHHRDPHTKHFWWDVRQVRPWSGFDAEAILALPGAAALLTCPVAAPLLPTPPTPSRHPETEAALHSIYAQHYLPRLNAALAVSSTRPLTFSVPPKPTTATTPADHLFVANGPGESSSAAALFGGRPSARVVGLVRSFDRFNTGMRVEGNVKRVEYLRGLAALHHAMREHGCRHGFILTEIELVVVRNGTDTTPHFGYLEVTAIQLASPPSSGPVSIESLQSGDAQMSACLALWGLCMLASDDVQSLAPGAHPHWRSEIGAPAEGTRRKALPRDGWMPPPQLAEKREAKRARGWVLPEDAVGRKELGKRGVRYAAC